MYTNHHRGLKFFEIGLGTLCGMVLPALAHAQEASATQSAALGVVATHLLQGTVWEPLVLGAFLIVSLIFTQLWVGSFKTPLIESKASKKTRYVPTLKSTVGTALAAVGLCLLSFRTMGGIAPFDGPHGLTRLCWFFIVAAAVGIVAQLKWPKAREYIFGICVSTLLTFILLGLRRVFFEGVLTQNAFYMAVLIISVILAWRFLFGPWKPHVKATVLATFLFWIGFNIYWQAAPTERLAYLLSFFAALVPSVIWCFLFLDFRKQRLALIFLMFFAGMVATVPVLFYDALASRGVELQFFVFRVIPENFTRVSSSFVSSSSWMMTGIQTTLMATLISFLIVGIIEEVSKFWVLKKSGQRFFSSIDEVIQFSIIVSIGFAFAENIINPTYFLYFVKEFLIEAANPNWMGFLGNVLGRSILTTMVHILSGGVLGYFFGLAVFAEPYLRDVHGNGKGFAFVHFIQWLFRVPEKVVFRWQMLLTGLLIAVMLHGVFNFLVTLQDILPGNPRTLGDLFNLPGGSPLHAISILLIPSLFYVVGGFWLLTALLLKEESMKVRGRLVRADTFVKQKATA